MLPRNPPGLDGSKGTLVVAARCSKLTHFLLYMGEQKNLLLKSAMFYGLLLGGFWVIKYIFFILGTMYPVASYAYSVLTPLTLIFAYIFTKVYKFLIGGKISFAHALQFGVLLYFCAALIVCLVHYVFYAYIASPEYMEEVATQAINMVTSMNLSEKMQNSIIEQMPDLTPIKMTVQGIMNNVFYGIIFSIPVAALVCRKDLSGLVQQNQQKEQQQ